QTVQLDLSAVGEGMESSVVSYQLSVEEMESLLETSLVASRSSLEAVRVEVVSLAPKLETSRVEAAALAEKLDTVQAELSKKIETTLSVIPAPISPFEKGGLKGDLTSAELSATTKRLNNLSGLVGGLLNKIVEVESRQNNLSNNVRSTIKDMMRLDLEAAAAANKIGDLESRWGKSSVDDIIKDITLLKKSVGKPGNEVYDKLSAFQEELKKIEKENAYLDASSASIYKELKALAGEVGKAAGEKSPLVPLLQRGKEGDLDSLKNKTIELKNSIDVIKETLEEGTEPVIRMWLEEGR
ncbi:MAG: hypothetical protein ABII25_03160, partial [bacterium]